MADNMTPEQRLQNLNNRLAAIEEVLVALIKVYGHQDEIRALTSASRGESIAPGIRAELEWARKQIDILLGLQNPGA